jgi:predicted dehydrogenase
MEEHKLVTNLANIGAWFSFLPSIEYIGVLCRERNDYTIIHLHGYNYQKAVQELRELLESRGEIMDIQYVHGQDYFQVWIRERRSEDIDILLEGSSYQWQPQVWMFAVFNADEWVIEVTE